MQCFKYLHNIVLTSPFSGSRKLPSPWLSSLGSHSSSSLPSSYKQPLICFLSVNLPILNILYKLNHKIYSLLPLIFLLSIKFSRSIHVIACIGTLFLSYGQIIFYCVDIIYCVHLLIHWWTFGLFLPFGFINSAAITVHVQVFVWKFICDYFGCISRSRISLFYDNYIFNLFKKKAKLFSIVAIPFTKGNIWVFQFLHNLINTCHFLYFWM